MDPIIPEGMGGLTTSEVKIRKKQGLSNVQPQKLTRSIGRIISDNILTLFNALNVGLALLVLFAGSYRNLLFFFTVLFNVAIGIVQEIRAKLTVEKMAVISAPRVRVIRDGKIVEMHMEDLVQDDLMLLTAGCQICADSLVVEGSIEVNESLLTGESDAVFKENGDELMSGSCVVSGQCVARVVHVGAENYSYKLVENATKHKKYNSMLMNELNRILKAVGVVIVPLGILLYLSMTFFGNVSSDTAIVSTVGALIGMIPQGLILLTSIALSVGTVKLASMKVLVQELYGIETLARVDVLCLDKTGTITDGNLKVEEVINFEDDDQTAISLFTQILSDDNQSINAIREYLKKSDQPATTDRPASNLQEKIRCAMKNGNITTLPFSSSRKMSAVSISSAADLPISGTYVLGAPDVLLKDVNADLREQIQPLCNNYSEQGCRVLLFAHTGKNIDGNDSGLCNGYNCNLHDEYICSLCCNYNCDWKILSIYVMSDCVRETVADVLDYFKKQDVSIYIFSGDNPLTIAGIAEKAGLEVETTGTKAETGSATNATDDIKFENTEVGILAAGIEVSGTEVGALAAVDASTLETTEALREALGKYRIFGRVSPEQKAELVRLLQADGQTVAMTGDGVNDVMALRAADCGIAMAGGADATRSVANIVLLEDNIDGLPSVIAEGRRVINNICRSASLFLVKTIFSVFLAVAFLLAGRAYPFQPIHLTLISSSAVGFASFFLSMEPNSERLSGHFLRQVIVKALPGSLTISINMLVLTFIYNHFGLSSDEYSTLCVLLTGGVYFVILFVVCYPFNKWRTGVFAASLAIFTLCFIFLKDLFLLTAVNLHMLIIFIVLFGVSVPVFWFFYKVLSKYFLSSRA